MKEDYSDLDVDKIVEEVVKAESVDFLKFLL
jgi:hypothetical protein